VNSSSDGICFLLGLCSLGIDKGLPCGRCPAASGRMLIAAGSPGQEAASRGELELLTPSPKELFLKLPLLPCLTLLSLQHAQTR
jgi:hypothetical protein